MYQFKNHHPCANCVHFNHCLKWGIITLWQGSICEMFSLISPSDDESDGKPQEVSHGEQPSCS